MSFLENDVPNIKNTSVVDRVVKFLVDSIINRDLKPGEKLPSETELSQKLGVGRNSVREAIKVLVTYGILEVRSRAEGTFVCYEFNDKMLDPLVYGIILEQGSSQNLIDLRRIIEVGTLQTAVNEATEEEIEDLKKILDALINSLTKENQDPKEVLHYDCAFHEQIEVCVHNPLLGKVSSMLTKITRYSRLQTIETLLKTNQQQYLIETHRNIYETIKNRDINRVATVVENSFQHWRIILDKDAQMKY